MEKKSLNSKDLLVLVAALLISFLFIFSAYFTGRKNSTFSRAPQRSKEIKIESGLEFLKEMEKRNVKGRVLLLLDESMHTEIPTFTPTLDAQENIDSLRKIYDPQKITPNEENFIYLALIEGRIKSIYLIAPRDKWEELIKEPPTPFLKLAKKALVGTFYDGTPVTISPSDYPIFPEGTALLLVNKSTFPEGENYLKNWREKRKLKFDLIFLKEKEGEI
jgi:hypothetical protein